ncbi:transporter [Pontibacter sp. H259]|uniref:transporter n=1 Tax=Pontibacter sp. H259 TaxID=3133421 RepID=UPI0030C289CE
MAHFFTHVSNTYRLLLVVALLLFISSQANSQQQDTTALPDLETDRPDQTESASVVPLKTIQIEAGLYFQQDKVGTTEVKYMAYPTTLIRIGLLNWFELRTEGTYQQLVVKDELRLKEQGFGPLTLGAKAKLWQQRGILPQTAVMAMVDLLVGHDSFKPDNPETELRLLFKNAPTDNLDLNYNLAYSFGNDQNIKSYSVSIATGLGERLAVFGEVFGDKRDGQKAGHSIDAGLVFLALPNLQLDVAAGTALNSVAPDLFILTGVSLRLPR